MNCAWMFYLNSNDYYLYMLLGMYKNLLDTKTIYPVYCGVTKNVTTTVQKILQTVGIKIINLDTSQIDACNLFKKNNFNGQLKWYINAIYKLAILESNIENKFDKIIYLDSDQQIFSNIDNLMECPHMSAVPNRSPKAQLTPYKLGFSNFCAGLFVWDFLQYRGLGHQLLSQLDQLPSNIIWHDQSILNFWFQDWVNKPELHLNAAYGLMNHKNIASLFKERPKIIHFTSRDRKNWPYLQPINLSKDWLYVKEWLQNIAQTCNYFNIKYQLSLPIIHYENIFTI